jgi:hypothetical protein
MGKCDKLVRMSLTLKGASLELDLVRKQYDSDKRTSLIHEDKNDTPKCFIQRTDGYNDYSVFQLLFFLE